MAENKSLSENMEDYLEAILELERTNKVARAKDIAEKLGIQRGSVTGGLKTLGEKGLIHYEPYSFVTLTQKGKKLAKEITNRHLVLKDFFMNVLKINSQTAELNACRVEHAIDQHVYEQLVCFIKFIHSCPRAGNDWLESFQEFCSTNSNNAEKCEKCVLELQTSH